MTTRRGGGLRRGEIRFRGGETEKQGLDVDQSTSSSPHIMDFRFWSMSLSSSSSVLPLLGLVHRWMRGVVKGRVGRREGVIHKTRHVPGDRYIQACITPATKKKGRGEDPGCISVVSVSNGSSYSDTHKHKNTLHIPNYYRQGTSMGEVIQRDGNARYPEFPFLLTKYKYISIYHLTMLFEITQQNPQ